jgi:hypothetical protein
MMRRFKKSIVDDGNYVMYEPTIMIQDSVMISDKFAKEKRMGRGSLNTTFLVTRRKT